MKVILVNNCHYRRGGADVVYLNTGELLTNKGHDVIYFSTNSPKNESSAFSKYFVDDVDALELTFTKQLLNTPRKLYSFQAKKNFERLILDTRPDIVHFHLYKGGLTASLLPVLRKNHVPSVITLHDYSLLCPRNIMLDGDGKICEKCLYSHPFNCVLKRCNRKNLFYSTINFIEYEINNKLFKPQNYFNKIICVCKFNYEKHLIKPNLKNRLVQFYNFSPDIGSSPPNNKKGDYFLYYGRLSDEKGIKTLVEAWKKLDNRYTLKIVGDGRLFKELAHYINENKLENIDLLGYKKGEELKEIIKKSSFVIVPSECYENNPMTMIEAYSMGIPVIGSKVGGIPEILNDLKNGFLFEMGNIDQLLSAIQKAFLINEQDYAKMSNAAWKFAQDNFAEEAYYISLINTYNDAINDFRTSTKK